MMLKNVLDCFHVRNLLLAALLLAVGCTTSGVRRDWAKVWTDPNAGADELLEAVRHLVPVGAAKQRATSVLGNDGKWIHMHGPTASIITDGDQLISQPGPGVDFWALRYSRNKSLVTLYFFKSGFDSYEFLKAGIVNELPNTAE